MKTLLIDNYDSFTYNLYHLIADVNGEEPIVVKNDALTLAQIQHLNVDSIVLSPGPGVPTKPADFGVCWDVLLNINLPILGVCLGHQGMCAVLGGSVVLADLPMHGRLSTIIHNNDALYANIPQKIQVMRYHSWVVKFPLPAGLEVIAQTDTGLIMALRHSTKPWWGVQYHPESIAGEYGRQLLVNFKHLAANYA